MTKYIVVFRASTIEDAVSEANDFSASAKDEILSASLSFVGSGNAFEKPALTCVFERKPLADGEVFLGCENCRESETCSVSRKALAKTCGCSDHREEPEKTKKKKRNT